MECSLSRCRRRCHMESLRLLRYQGCVLRLRRSRVMSTPGPCGRRVLVAPELHSSRSTINRNSSLNSSILRRQVSHVPTSLLLLLLLFLSRQQRDTPKAVLGLLLQCSTRRSLRNCSGSSIIVTGSLHRSFRGTLVLCIEHRLLGHHRSCLTS